MEELPSGRSESDTGPVSVVQEIARALGEAATLDEAGPAMLSAVCRAFGWEYGALWEVDRAGKKLRCSSTWNDPTLRFTDFLESSRAIAFETGVGLPGRVWAAGRPDWIPDVSRDSNFPRAASAARAGLRSAVALPILRGADV